VRFDDDRVDLGNVDDRRGGGGLGGGGLLLAGLVGRRFGLPGLLVVGAVLLLMGMCGGPGSGAGGQGLQGQGLRAKCAEPGAIERYDDCFLVKSFNEINEVWEARLGPAYRPPTLVLFSDRVGTRCGTATSQVGPFYCPGDETVYIDLEFMALLQQRIDAPGRYAQSYILAHEVGHHLQTLLGTEPRVRRAQQGDPEEANELSVALELQADCYAGVWGRRANDQGNVVISEAEFRDAMDAAAGVGDDRIQAEAGARVDPETWTHGSSQQRQGWFSAGYSSGELARCDTFSAGAGG
jgi:predicted metalloprotease